jgi:peptide chain release factor
MQLQISSGQGPLECELAVGKLAEALCAEFENTVIKQTNSGLQEGCFRSAIIESEQDLSFLDGTVKWICPSPLRPHHKRKNWFVDVSPLESASVTKLDKSLIKFETFKSGGKGGQHVNKTESGIRATYIPLGLSAISTDERSQHLNKKVATERLCKLVEEHNAEGKRATTRSNWLEHTRLVRGNAIRVYEGLEFKRVE